MPSAHCTGAPAGHVGQPCSLGAHQPLCGQHTVPDGQHEPLHDTAHTQMPPRPPWHPPVETQLESPQQ